MGPINDGDVVEDFGIQPPELPVRRRVPAWSLIALLGAVAAFAALIVIDDIFAADRPTGEAGRLHETQRQRPPEVPGADLSDSSSEWGLAEIEMSPGGSLSGGAALADIDRDGDLDLVVVNGSAIVMRWDQDRFGRPTDLGFDDANATTIADLDRDGWPDILIAREGTNDTIVWGGNWVAEGGPRETSDLGGGNGSATLIAADLDRDGFAEIVRLGRGGNDGSPDVIWSSNEDNRTFSPRQLPNSDRLSLAAEIADIDGDGLLDIWVTRDVGYDTGGDSLYSRRGDLNGEWFDIAGDIDSALAVDGMGVTLADIDGDLDIDAYVSDIGDNEILLATPSGFIRATDTGAARIRPPGADEATISSSWASGAADINLDGRLDLVVVGGGFPYKEIQNKVPATEVAESEPPAILLGIGDGKFVDDWPSLELDFEVVGRALTMGDIDHDGDTDIVIVGRDGTVTGLRNETSAPSVTVTFGPNCGVGNELEVVTRTGTYRAVAPAHTYGGAHAAQVSVGVRDGRTAVRLVRPDFDPITRTLAPTTTRQQISIDCEVSQ